MKLARFADWTTGLIGPNGMILHVIDSVDAVAAQDSDCADAVRVALGPTEDWTGLIADWPRLRPVLERYAGLAENGGGVFSEPDPSVLRAPLPTRHPRVFALGANFADHGVKARAALGIETTEAELLAEREKGLPPWGFTVIPESIVGPDAEICPPPGTALLDYEAEVAVVLASGGRDLAARDLHVWGVTCWNDLTIRDHMFGLGEAVDRGAVVWALAKNFDTANSCGPWLDLDLSSAAGDLRLQSRVNGVTRQDATTAAMIYSFGDTIEHLSRYLRLLPGDMLVSGTPAGTALESGVDGGLFLQPGDLVEVEVESVGVLRNRIASQRHGGSVH